MSRAETYHLCPSTLSSESTYCNSESVYILSSVSRYCNSESVYILSSVSRYCNSESVYILSSVSRYRNSDTVPLPPKAGASVLAAARVEKDIVLPSPNTMASDAETHTRKLSSVYAPSFSCCSQMYYPFHTATHKAAELAL